MSQTNNVNTADDEPNIIPGGSHEGGEEVELSAVSRATTIERRAHAHVRDSSDTVLKKSCLAGSPSADVEEGITAETSGDLEEGTANPRWPEINIDNEAPSPPDFDAILNDNVDGKRPGKKTIFARRGY